VLLDGGGDRRVGQQLPANKGPTCELEPVDTGPGSKYGSGRQAIEKAHGANVGAAP
jgi:hypothetical protein